MYDSLKKSFFTIVALAVFGCAEIKQPPSTGQTQGSGEFASIVNFEMGSLPLVGEMRFRSIPSETEKGEFALQFYSGTGSERTEAVAPDNIRVDIKSSCGCCKLPSQPIVERNEAGQILVSNIAWWQGSWVVKLHEGGTGEELASIKIIVE